MGRLVCGRRGARFAFLLAVLWGSLGAAQPQLPPPQFDCPSVPATGSPAEDGEPSEGSPCDGERFELPQAEEEGAVRFPTWWSREMQRGCSGHDPVTFGSAPMRLDDIINVGPYGLMVGAHVIPSDHQGYSFPRQGPGPAYDVLAVADGEIVQVTVRNVSVDTGRPSSPQYHITLRHSCSIVSQYDLVDELDPALAAHAESLRMGIPVPVKEGQVIGRTGASSQGMDLWVADLRTLAPGYAVPEHYLAEPWRVYAIEPFSLFAEPLRSQLRARSIRRAEPRGGRADTDIDGRLVGGWFVEGTNGYAGTSQRDFFRTHLAVTYHAYDPTAVIVSLGDFEGRPRQFGVRGNGPDPAQVSMASGQVKYELASWAYFVGNSGRGWDYRAPVDNLRVLPGTETLGTLLLQLVGERQLKVEVFPGKHPNQVNGFTAAAQMYER